MKRLFILLASLSLACSIFAMDQKESRTERVRSMTLLQRDVEASLWSKLKSEAQKNKAKTDDQKTAAKNLFSTALKANAKEWAGFFECAISENGEARVRSKLRILAGLLLPRLNELTESTLFFGFLNLYEAFPEENLDEKKNHKVLELLNKLHQAIDNNVNTLLAQPKERWSDFFAQDFDGYSLTLKKKLLTAFALALLPKIDQLDRTDQSFIDLFFVKATSIYGRRVHMHPLLAVHRVLAALEQKDLLKKTGIYTSSSHYAR